MKTVVKRFLAHTPYKIVRRERSLHGDGPAFDATMHNSLENMNRVFSSRAVLDGYVTPGRRRLYAGTKQILMDAAPPDRRLTIGDFGCGPGDFFTTLVPEYAHCQFFGYDFADATLVAARERFPQATYSQYNLYTPPARTHDVVISSQTLEHLMEPELALRHLLQATAPGGVLILTVPDGRVDTYKGHVQFWSPESWKAWIQRNAPGDPITTTIAGGTMGGANLAAVIRV